MDQDKVQTIVAEIDKWRRSKLLPEHYCDFLMNLYMDDREVEGPSVLGISQKAVSNSNWKTWLSIIAITGIISFIGLHFTSFSFWMQTGVLAVLAVTLYLVGAAQRLKQPLVSCLCFGGASGILLLGGIYLLHLRDAGTVPLVFVVALCGMIWILTGIAAKFPVFHFAGWLLLLLIYGLVLRHNITDIDWIGVELSWVPLSLVLCWLAWLLHHVNKQISAVFFLTGVLCWFGGELYGFVWTGLDKDVLQLLLGAKLAVGGGVLFALRKKWVEWVM